ncbi:hypothetical protein VP01_2951g2 [Puccinia sorghi]|uniref:Uncharacterized protein n=1 Tax=Puccinia sorghi TaxID=27349 RepID=A0A0L6V0Z3_9BASI|nr:hypothetical protein VP01_2951g2 [Puccinia sorghi]
MNYLRDREGQQNQSAAGFTQTSVNVSGFLLSELYSSCSLLAPVSYRVNITIPDIPLRLIYPSSFTRVCLASPKGHKISHASVKKKRCLIRCRPLLTQVVLNFHISCAHVPSVHGVVTLYIYIVTYQRGLKSRRISYLGFGMITLWSNHLRQIPSSSTSSRFIKTPQDLKTSRHLVLESLSFKIDRLNNSRRKISHPPVLITSNKINCPVCFFILFFYSLCSSLFFFFFNCWLKSHSSILSFSFSTSDTCLLFLNSSHLFIIIHLGNRYALLICCSDQFFSLCVVIDFLLLSYCCSRLMLPWNVWCALSTTGFYCLCLVILQENNNHPSRKTIHCPTKWQQALWPPSQTLLSTSTQGFKNCLCLAIIIIKTIYEWSKHLKITYNNSKLLVQNTSTSSSPEIHNVSKTCYNCSMEEKLGIFMTYIRGFQHGIGPPGLPARKGLPGAGTHQKITNFSRCVQFFFCQKQPPWGARHDVNPIPRGNHFNSTQKMACKKSPPASAQATLSKTTSASGTPDRLLNAATILFAGSKADLANRYWPLEKKCVGFMVRPELDANMWSLNGSLAGACCMSTAGTLWPPSQTLLSTSTQGFKNCLFLASKLIIVNIIIKTIYEWSKHPKSCTITQKLLVQNTSTSCSLKIHNVSKTCYNCRSGNLNSFLRERCVQFFLSKTAPLGGFGWT